MFKKINLGILAGPAILFVVALSILSMPARVSAAPTMDSAPNSCLTCHEDLYYLHDTGKYYCISEHKDRCVNCHDGDAAAMKEDQAHAGLIAHPQENDGAKCQECHADDAQARIDSFAEGSGGFAAVIKAESYVPSTEPESGFPDTTEENAVVEYWPFLVGAVIVFGLWLVFVFLSPLKS